MSPYLLMLANLKVVLLLGVAFAMSCLLQLLFIAFKGVEHRKSMTKLT